MPSFWETVVVTCQCDVFDIRDQDAISVVEPAVFGSIVNEFAAFVRLCLMTGRIIDLAHR